MSKRISVLWIAFGALIGLLAGAVLDRYVLSRHQPGAPTPPQQQADGQPQRPVVPPTKIATSLDLRTLLQEAVADRAASSTWPVTVREPTAHVSSQEDAVACLLKDARQGPAIADTLITSVEKRIDSGGGALWQRVGSDLGGPPFGQRLAARGYRLDGRSGHFLICSTQYNDSLSLVVCFYETDED